jgi:TRAP-type C4-dicarboxylate transport system substrate-binding protein
MKRFCCIGFLLVLFCIGTLVVSAPGFAAEEKITLRFANFFPPTHKHAILMDDWCKEVTKRTNGRVEAKHYPGGTLSPAPQIYDAVAKGVVDVGETVLGYTMGKFPLTEVLDYPIGHFSADVSTRMVNAYFEKFKPKEFDDVKVMFFHAQTPGIIHSRKPITKLEDLKGQKLRTFGTNADVARLLGATPVAMTMGEAYDAIAKGVADGFLSPYEALEGWKTGEVIKYSVENYGTAYCAMFIIAMNKAKWASISPADQKIIEDINKEFLEKQIKVWEEIDISGKQFSLNRGNKVATLTPQEEERWKRAVEPMFIRYVNDMKTKGLPGAEVLKFSRDYIANAKKASAPKVKAPAKAPVKAPAAAPKK